jgi:restriction system protein
MARRKKRKQSSRLFWLVLGALVAAFLILAAARAAASALGVFALPIAVALLGLAVYVSVRYRRRRRLRVKAFNELLALTPARFELAVADLLRDAGYRSVKRVGRSGDLGADIVCRDRKGRSVVVQCKRHAPGIKVGSKDMQAFIGMMKVHHQADTGIFVTTSEFTAPAAELAGKHGVELMDGRRLGQLVARGRDFRRSQRSDVIESAEVVGFPHDIPG